MPAFGDALGREDLLRVIGHIRTLCTDTAWPRGELNLPRALVTEKAFPENEAVLTTSIDTGSPGAVGNEFLYEQRLGSRTQFEIVVPLDLLEGSPGDWRGGLGDVAVALKRVLFHSLPRGAILSAAGEIVFPTGKEDNGLGTGVTIFEPFLAYGQILPRDNFLQLQGGFELSSNTSLAGHEAFWRGVVGRTFIEGEFGRAWSPMIEFLGSRELEDDEPAHWDLVPQLQVSLSRRQHILLNVGVRFPINDRNGRSTTVITYLLWDWFDGGFLSGWR
jgi:hypothetical protein